MSQENVDVVLGQFESTNARDFAAVDGANGRGGRDRSRPPRGHRRGQVGTGKEAVAGWFWNYFREFASDWAVRGRGSFATGVIASSSSRGTMRGGRASGAQVTSPEWRTCTRCGGGKVSQIRVWRRPGRGPRSRRAVGVAALDEKRLLSPQGAGGSISTSSEMKIALSHISSPILMPDHRYGYAHKRMRKRWGPKVRAGKVVCARCGEPIAPDAKWDLDHDDANPRRYLGPHIVVVTGRR